MILHIIYVTVYALLCGIIPVATQVAQRSGQISPGAIAFYRYLCGFIFICIIQCMRGKKIWGNNWKDIWCAVAGAALGINFIFLNKGLESTTACVGGLLMNTCLPVMLLYGLFFLKERFGIFRFSSFVLGVLGLLLAGTNGFDLMSLKNSGAVLGNILVATSGCIWATYTFAQKKSSQGELGIIEGLLPIMGYGTAVVFLYTVFAENIVPEMTAEGYGAILLLGFGATGFSYFLLAKGLTRVSLGTAGMICSLTPAVTLVVAPLYLDEKITWFSIVSLVLIVCAIVLSNIEDKKQEELVIALGAEV
jgi:drug/metabolite transporter (DMT)-like permease